MDLNVLIGCDLHNIHYSNTVIKNKNQKLTKIAVKHCQMCLGKSDSDNACSYLKFKNRHLKISFTFVWQQFRTIQLHLTSNDCTACDNSCIMSSGAFKFTFFFFYF